MNQSLIKQLGFIAISMIGLHSCSLNPPYHRPCTEIPEAWRVDSSKEDTSANIKWWEQLHDPVLNELIIEALDNNKNIQVAVARVLEFKAQLGIVNSQLYPQINAQGMASRQRFSQTLKDGFNALAANDSALDPVNSKSVRRISPFINDYRTVVNASYDLDFWGKIRSASDAAYSDLLAQVEARRTVVLSVVTSLANAYIVLRQYDQQLNIAKQTYESRKQSYDLAVIRFEEGLTSQLEVKQAASEVDEAQIQIIELNTLIPQQENLISILVGHSPDTVLRGHSMEQWNLPEIPAGLPSDILEQRPDILQAEYGLMAANARVGEARAQFFPDITLTAYYGSETSQLHQLFTNPSKIWDLVGNLLQPIFEGGRLISNLDFTKAVKREAYYTYQQTILNALQEVNNALIAHEQSKKGVEAQHQRVSDLEGYVQLATLQYDNGLVDYLNVLDAERRLFAAELDLAAAEAMVFTTLVSLYQALGGGWVIDADNEVLCVDNY